MWRVNKLRNPALPPSCQLVTHLQKEDEDVAPKLFGPNDKNSDDNLVSFLPVWLPECLVARKLRDHIQLFDDSFEPELAMFESFSLLF